MTCTKTEGLFGVGFWLPGCTIRGIFRFRSKLETVWYEVEIRGNRIVPGPCRVFSTVQSQCEALGPMTVWIANLQKQKQGQDVLDSTYLRVTKLYKLGRS